MNNLKLVKNLYLFDSTKKSNTFCKFIVQNFYLFDYDFTVKNEIEDE